MIITNYFNNITEYINLGNEIYVPTICGCNNCGYEGTLHRHGYYSRNVITKNAVLKVPILRVKCPSCNKTHAIIPDFLTPYFQYSFDFIFETLSLTYVMSCSYSSIVNKFNSSNPQISFNESNIYFFKRRMKNVTHITNSFFTNFEDLYYNMDNPSESKVINKIKDFIKKIGNFNYSYFKIMPRYFFCKT